MRFREHGFAPGILKPGRLNRISDVAGVTVGHHTRMEGERVRTGVTVVDPGTPRLYHEKLPAAVAVGNGFGKLTGSTQVDELGTLEAPIALTSTLAVGQVLQGMVRLVLDNTPDIPADSTVNVLVGETNDGVLNDSHLTAILPSDAGAAWQARSAGFAIGCVGAGTGTSAFSWKGGIGTASRVVPVEGAKYTVGALLQTNFGGALTIMGVPVGTLLGKTNFDVQMAAADGSCMIVLATDAPLSARQLGRIARRAMLGLARTGSVLAHGSGDYAIAFSTSRAGVEGAGCGGMGECLPDGRLNLFFLAAVEAVEESVYDALFAAETVVGRDGNRLERLPVEPVLEMLRKHG